MGSLDPFKKVAIEAVKKAEESIMHYFRNLPPIETKVDRTPVTKADKEAEEIIIDTIKKAFPNHGFFGEEFGKDNEEAEFVWIIDPIDGTKNFIHHIDFFGTVLGLKHEGKIVLGVSNMPALGELLFASENEGTTLNGKAVCVSSVDSLSEAYVMVSGFHGLEEDRYREALLSVRNRTTNMRGLGDMHGYHLVATGRAEVMFEIGPKPWDISAFQIIIKQAGGQYSDFNGDAFALGPTCLATNGLLHTEILKTLSASGKAW